MFDIKNDLLRIVEVLTRNIEEKRLTFTEVEIEKEYEKALSLIKGYHGFVGAGVFEYDEECSNAIRDYGRLVRSIRATY